MPIKPENRDRYPKEWPMIRERILRRASNRCEFCGKPNGVYVAAGPDGQWVGLGRDIPEDWKEIRTILVVLTVAHLDHQPEHNEDDNLRALCQRCHNRHDVGHRAETRRETLKVRRKQLELF